MSSGQDSYHERGANKGWWAISNSVPLLSGYTRSIQKSSTGTEHKKQRGLQVFGYIKMGLRTCDLKFRMRILSELRGSEKRISLIERWLGVYCGQPIESDRISPLLLINSLSIAVTLVFLIRMLVSKYCGISRKHYTLVGPNSTSIDMSYMLLSLDAEFVNIADDWHSISVYAFMLMDGPIILQSRSLATAAVSTIEASTWQQQELAGTYCTT